MVSLSGARILVIGVGNCLRGDDAAGALVVKRICDRNDPSLRAVAHEGDGASLMEAWRGKHTVVVVDAVSSEEAPGTILRFDATQQPLPARLFCHSTHAFGLCEAVELSRSLNSLPRQLIIYGIQAKSFAIGGQVSTAVEKSVKQVVDRILKEPAHG